MPQVIAFDFFDTLVHRDCHPETVLVKWARQMSLFSNFRISAREIYETRKEIESNIHNNGEEDFAYKELIECLYEKFKTSFEGKSKQQFVEKSFNEEVNIELEHLYIDRDNCTLLKKLSNNYTIVLISDFYCSEDFFKIILENFGLLKFFDKLYISSEIGKRKSTGSLYEFVLADLNITANELLMIGDNQFSDCFIPKRKGIQTKLISYKSLCVLPDINDLIHKIKYFECRDIFSGYASLVLLFIERLYKKAVQNGVDCLLFCSREGQNLLYLFNEYQNRLYKKHKIKAKYFYVSRKSTLCPSLKNIENETFFQIFRQFHELSIYDFLYNIGFLNSEIIEICNLNHFRTDTIVTNSENDCVLEQLRSCDLFKKLYDKRREEEQAKLEKYINYLVGKSKQIYIVDIGWKGTIQDNLKSSLGNGYSLVGFYFGLNKDTVRSDGNQKFGLIFDINKKSCNSEFFSYCCVNLEHVFAADHGQTVGYREKDNEIEPILSSQKDDLAIYEYVNMYQVMMNRSIIELIELLTCTKYDMEDLTYQITKSYVAFSMTIIPKNFKFFFNLRKKFKENFGNITGRNIGSNEVKFKVNFKGRQEKLDFYFVDYTYRLLDKCNLKFAYPLAFLYCKLAYLVKRRKIKK